MSRSVTFFLRQFLAAPRSVGAVFPSSEGLAAAMLAPVDFERARAVVEFGPGTGAFTRAIARKLAPGARYLGIEINPVFSRRLAADFPGLSFVQASVADLGALLGGAGICAVDAVICGLPWASLPRALQDAVFAQIAAALAPDGVFVTFAYVQGLAFPGAWALRKSLRRTFADVSRTPVVWANLPPAFAYVCRSPRTGR
jgi:phospholipid N-methyltransferase